MGIYSLTGHDGYTLIELLVSFAIALIILSIAIPSQQLFFQRTGDQMISSALLHAISLARNEAMTRGELITLCGSADLKQCDGQWQIGYMISSATEKLYRFQLIKPDGLLYWRTFPKNRDDLQFTASGLPNTQNGTFWYCRNGMKKPSWAIVLNQSGRARFVDADEQSLSDSLACIAET